MTAWSRPTRSTPRWSRPAERPRRARRCAGALVAAVLLVAACGDDGSAGDASAPSPLPTKGDPPAATGAPADRTDQVVVLNGQGNNLDAYAPAPDAEGDFTTQRVIETVATDPEGRDVNAQICPLPPGAEGEQLFIAGEDTGQDDPSRPAGWGLFRLTGDRVGELRAEQVGKLVTTFPDGLDDPENYGCGVLADGRVLTTDVGDQASGTGNGQLIIWFPPLTGGEAPDHVEVAHCKLAVDLPTGQSILVRDDDVLVASARGDVVRYPGPFPTGPDAAGGCGGRDATGAPLAEEVAAEVFVEAGEHGLSTPSGLAPAPDGGVYVSSVFSGVINEYGPDGSFRRTILAPAEGDAIGEEPYATGTPLGLAVGPDGTLYYADIGLTISDDGVGPGEGTGTLRRITFVDGEPGEPEVMADGLAFPDGVGVVPIGS